MPNYFETRRAYHSVSESCELCVWYICYIEYNRNFFLNQSKLTSGNAVKEALSYRMECCNLTCENHKVDGQKVVISTTVNAFFNNKWKISTESVKKDNAAAFKKQKTKAIFLWYSLIIIVYLLSCTLRYLPPRSVLICQSFHHLQLTHLKKGEGNFWKIC